jgi:hypothetical protein
MIYIGDPSRQQQDFLHDWQRTYAYLDDKPVYIHNCVLDSKNRLSAEIYDMRIESFDKSGKWLSKSELVPFRDFKFSLPRVRVFQFDNTALFFTRHITRQFKRGLCDSNSSLLTPSGDSWGFEDSRYAIATLMTPKPYMSFGDALKRVENNGGSVAVSPELAVGFDGDIVSPVMYYLNKPVGFINNKHHMLLLGEWEFLGPKIRDHVEIENVI